MKNISITECRWCGKLMDVSNGYECYRCWNLRAGIESNIELSSKILAHIIKRTSGDGAGSTENPIGPEMLTCGHEAKFLVYSQLRNYCAVCGETASLANIPFRKPDTRRAANTSR